MTATTELPKVDQVTIAQKGEDFLKDQAMMEELVEQKIALRKENDRLAEQLFKSMSETAEVRKELDRINALLLVKSTVISGRANYTRKLTMLFRAVWQDRKLRGLKLRTSNMHLDKMLEEKEHEFDRTQGFESCEIASDYIDAALYMESYFNRKGNRIEAAQQWYDSQPVLQK